MKPATLRGNADMKKSIMIGLLVAATLVLAACSEGDTRSGYGDNAGLLGYDTGAGIAEIPGLEPDVPAHCAKLGYKYVKKLIGCSQDSYRRCVCMTLQTPINL